MNVKDFWKKREQTHQKQLFKYLKYVFNDHFVLVLVFFAGAAGYIYSEYVKTVPQDALFPRMAVWLLLFAALFIGKVATLIHPADAVFLLPLETKMDSLLQKMKRRSFLFPAVILLLASAAAMPLLVALGAADFSQWVLAAGSLLVLKDIELEYQLVSFKLWDEKTKRILGSVVYGGALLSVFLLVFVSPWLAVIVSAAINGTFRFAFKSKIENSRWRWEKMIQDEKKRMQRIYRFINLFTDIPVLSDQPKRRKWADGFIHRFSSQKKSPYLYLYLRGFVRGTSYSGLFFRLSLIGAAVILFTDWLVLAMGAGVLFLYLIGFQLIPLYHHFDDSLLLKLYPEAAGGKMKAIQTVLLVLLLTSSLIFFAASLFSFNVLESFGLFGVFMIFSCLFVWGYVPRRLRKQKRGMDYEGFME